MAARVLLQDLVTREILDWDVPLTGADYARTLSGPGGISGDLPEGYPFPVKEWRHALWVEDSGTFHGGGIVTTVEHDDRAIRVDCVGPAGYASDMPWLAPREDLIEVDPLVIVRKVWNHLQSEPGGNLHMTVDSTTSPVRVGEEEREVEFTTGSGEDVSFETGPFRLNAVDTQDLLKTVNDLSEDTPFDYLEETYWDGELIAHRLRLGYPQLGVKRPEFRYHTTENLAVLPVLGMDFDTYASEVLFVGAGEGRDAVTAHVPSTPTRLRRVAIVADKSVRSKSGATKAAKAELEARTEAGEVTTLEVIDSAQAPLDQLNPGDTIFVSGPLATGAELNHWVRVTEIVRSIEDQSTATVTVIPSA